MIKTDKKFVGIGKCIKCNKHNADLCEYCHNLELERVLSEQKNQIINEIKERLDKAIDFPQLDRKRTEGVYIYQELIKVKLLEMLK